MVHRVPLRQIYEEQLNEYAERVMGLQQRVHGKEGRKLSRRAREAIIEEAARQPDMQIPGAPDVLPHVVDRGPAQLEGLTAGGEWCLTIVDVKMTTTQTAQGKKSRYSAMVMVGNLCVRPCPCRPRILLGANRTSGLTARRRAPAPCDACAEPTVLRLQGKGGYGVGVGKDANVALFKAVRFAILGAINVPLYRGHTLYYPSKTKFVRTKISIFPRPSDFGITASPILTEACELIGIQNLSVKVCTPTLRICALVAQMQRLVLCSFLAFFRLSQLGELPVGAVFRRCLCAVAVLPLGRRGAPCRCRCCCALPL